MVHGAVMITLFVNLATADKTGFPEKLGIESISKVYSMTMGEMVFECGHSVSFEENIHILLLDLVKPPTRIKKWKAK